MKKLVFLILLLSLTRIGASYAETTTANNSSDFFFGSKSASANLNQVLALLVGPTGLPGAVGAAGADGLIGLTGAAGADGLPGAPGAAGIQGIPGVGVLAVAFTGAQGTCTTGGVRFLDAAGAQTFACNGAAGAAGAAGPAGPAGAAGAGGTGGGGGTITYGAGQLSTGTCETDGIVKLGVTRTFSGTDFVFNEFTLGESGSTNDLNVACAGKTVSFYLKVVPASVKVITYSATAPGRPYQNDDVIKCSYALPAAGAWPNGVPQFTLGTSDLLCTSTPVGGTPRAAAAINIFDRISTSDYTDTIGLEIV